MEAECEYQLSMIRRAARRIRSRVRARTAGPGRDHVYLLLPTPDASGGIARVTVNLANYLADHHSHVEIIGLYPGRTADGPRHRIDRRVKLTYITDRTTAPHATRLETSPNRRSLVRHPFVTRLAARPSVIGADAYTPMNGLTDRLLARKLRTLRPGVVVAARMELARAALRWASPHMITVSHEHVNFATKTEEGRRAQAAVAVRVDATVVLTQQDEHDLAAYLGEERVRMVTIPNALSWPARPVQPPDRKVVLGAGRLMDQKDFATLVTAFAGIARRHLDWQLHIWGEGPLERPLRRQVRELRLQRQVKLKGYSTQFGKTLRTGSILAMTSKYEGLPMVLLEAMSRGLAPVSFGELIPAREVIIDDVNGVLVEPRTPEAMGEALSALMSDPARRRRLGERAVRTAQDYDMSRIGPSWDELFDDLLRRRTTPGQAHRSGVTA